MLGRLASSYIVLMKPIQLPFFGGELRYFMQKPKSCYLWWYQGEDRFLFKVTACVPTTRVMPPSSSSIVGLVSRVLRKYHRGTKTFAEGQSSKKALNLTVCASKQVSWLVLIYVLLHNCLWLVDSLYSGQLKNLSYICQLHQPSH